MNDEEFILLVIGQVDPTRDHEVRVHPVDYQRFCQSPSAKLRVDFDRGEGPARLWVNSEQSVNLIVDVNKSRTPGVVSFSPFGGLGPHSRHIMFYESEAAQPEYASRFERDFDL